MRYQNIGSMFCRFVAKHACDRQTQLRLAIKTPPLRDHYRMLNSSCAECRLHKPRLNDTFHSRSSIDEHTSFISSAVFTQEPPRPIPIPHTVILRETNTVQKLFAEYFDVAVCRAAPRVGEL